MDATDPLDQHRRSIKERYDFAAWPAAEPIAAGAGAVPRAVVLDPAAVPGMAHEERVPLPEPGAWVDRFTDASGIAGRIGVWLRHLATPQDAREALIDELATSMAPQLPRCSEHGLELGDVCFCSTAAPPDMVLFVRGHVLVKVKALDEPGTPVGDVAAAVDAQVRSALATSG